MTRAGKEPAEDVKRALIRAIHLAGLKVQRVQMFKGGVEGRIVFGAANPEGWAHEYPAIEMHAFVDFNGTIGSVEIRCSANDEDRIMNVYRAPTVRDCSCELENLSEILAAVWKERKIVLDWVKRVDRESRFVGRWVWAPPVGPLGDAHLGPEDADAA